MAQGAWYFKDYYESGVVVKRTFDDDRGEVDFVYKDNKLAEIDRKVWMNEMKILFEYITASKIKVTEKSKGYNTEYTISKTASKLTYSSSGDTFEIVYNPMYKKMSYKFGNIDFLDPYFNIQSDREIEGFYKIVKKFDPCGNLILYAEIVAESGIVAFAESYKYIY